MGFLVLLVLWVAARGAAPGRRLELAEAPDLEVTLRATLELAGLAAADARAIQPALQRSLARLAGVEAEQVAITDITEARRLGATALRRLGATALVDFAVVTVVADGEEEEAADAISERLQRTTNLVAGIQREVTALGLEHRGDLDAVRASVSDVRVEVVVLDVAPLDDMSRAGPEGATTTGFVPEALPGDPGLLEAGDMGEKKAPAPDSGDLASTAARDESGPEAGAGGAPPLLGVIGAGLTAALFCLVLGAGVRGRGQRRPELAKAEEEEPVDLGADHGWLVTSNGVPDKFRGKAFTTFEEYGRWMEVLDVLEPETQLRLHVFGGTVDVFRSSERNQVFLHGSRDVGVADLVEAVRQYARDYQHQCSAKGSAPTRFKVKPVPLKALAGFRGFAPETASTEATSADGDSTPPNQPMLSLAPMPVKNTFIHFEDPKGSSQRTASAPAGKVRL